MTLARPEVLGRRPARRRHPRGVWASVGWLVFVVGGALLADVLPLAEARNPANALSEPVLGPPDLFSSHPLGTDRQGLDLLAQCFYGARVSLTVALVAVLVAGVIGSTLGIWAAYYKGRSGRLIVLGTDCLLAFPPLIFLLAVATAFRPSVLTMALALAFVGIPTYIRVARANALVAVNLEYVKAARVLGGRDRWIIVREIVPTVFLPLASYALTTFGVLIVVEASLSFLGLGIARPAPTWGNMIAVGSEVFPQYPFVVLVPAVFLSLTVLAVNTLGERGRQLWDIEESHA